MLKKCRFCKNKDLKIIGKIRNGGTNWNLYKCSYCKREFTEKRDDLYRSEKNLIIIKVQELYNGGRSTRDITKIMYDKYRCVVSPNSVLNYVNNYKIIDRKNKIIENKNRLTLIQKKLFEIEDLKRRFNIVTLTESEKDSLRTYALFKNMEIGHLTNKIIKDWLRKNHKEIQKLKKLVMSFESRKSREFIKKIKRGEF